jgi:hypothetical protein
MAAQIKPVFFGVEKAFLRFFMKSVKEDRYFVLFYFVETKEVMMTEITQSRQSCNARIVIHPRKTLAPLTALKIGEHVCFDKDSVSNFLRICSAKSCEKLIH